MSEQTLGKARGLNSIADPAEFKGSRGRRETPSDGPHDTPPAPPPPRPEDRNGLEGGAAPSASLDLPPTPHRAVVPGVRRKRRELSIPVPVADALAATGINPADVVMSAYRTHSDAVFAGAGGRLVSRGRERLRLSISDAEFDKISRLGEARGWNRSETVAVLLTMELLPAQHGTDVPG
ncbi:MAG: hypothetical protein WBM50_04080 [Acidimicrobiales bacterium]